MPDIIDRLNTALEGRYRISHMLGEGGMATVYLADDLRHERRVALKVLKPELAAVVGAERFLAEIKTTANLHHPHILPLFDSGEADGFLFYVMPYVEGETLRDRLDRDRQLPVEEAVAITTAVAKALQHAHDRGVIHRDIKPANVLLQDGQPVVSDFGIALAVGSAGGHRLTETGLSVGTPYYMSPEQATGDQHVGPASDIYAQAAVLYEMLIGDPPYIGSTAQAILGKIIQGTPVSATAARSSVPAHVDAAIRKGLEKLPADRFQSADDFAKALTDPTFRHGDGPGAEPAAAAGPWKRVALAAVGVAAIALGVAGLILRSARSGADPPVARFTVPLGHGIFLGGEGTLQGPWPTATSLALSPDGALLVFAAFDTTGSDAHSRLYLKRLEQERAEAIPGTEGADDPFFSPGGDWIGFYAGASIRKVPVAGGDVVTVVADADPVARFRDATWGDDGTIAYVGGKGVYVVPSGGGESKLVAGSDSVRNAQAHFLPGRNVLLLTVWTNLDPRKGEIVAFDLSGGARKQLLADAMNPVYVPPGYLLFLRRGTLMGVAFDAGRLEVTGEPFIVAEDVMQALAMPGSGGETGAAQVAVSRTGHLVYATGGVHPPRQDELVRVRPNGSVEPLAVPPGPYLHVRASPTGERIAYNVEDMRALSIRVFDLGRGVTETLSPGGYTAEVPSWSADGRELAFDVVRDDGTAALYRMPADGSGEAERLIPVDGRLYDWSAEGVLAYLKGDDIWVLPPGGQPQPFFTSKAAELWATFSTDGHWIAYGGNQTGAWEVYVRPYPGRDPANKVSLAGGTRPVWSRDGRHIYYVATPPSGRVLMAADVGTGPEFRVEGVRRLIDPWPYRGTVPVRSYDVFPDGSFVTVRSTVNGRSAFESLAAWEVHVVLNFAEELKRRTGGG